MLSDRPRINSSAVKSKNPLLVSPVVHRPVRTNSHLRTSRANRVLGSTTNKPRQHDRIRCADGMSSSLNPLSGEMASARCNLFKVRSVCAYVTQRRARLAREASAVPWAPIRSIVCAYISVTPEGNCSIVSSRSRRDMHCLRDSTCKDARRKLHDDRQSR